MRRVLAVLTASVLLIGCRGPGNVSTPPDELVEGGGNTGGGDDVEDCVPITCAAAAKNCGTLPDGCGGTISCGACGSGETCGGGGTANVCGAGTCAPVSCADKGKDCGMVSDGCAGVLECGTCTQPEFCGGAGTKNVCGEDTLATATGCAGVFNPNQVLDLFLTMNAADWTAVQNDPTNADYRNATFQCGDDPPLPFQVSVRKKRSGSVGGKPGLKVDFNRVVPGSDWQTLKKLSLENGISEGSATSDLGALVSEYVGWRFMVRSGAYSSRAAFIRLHVNGTLIGTYVNVEQVDRRFLRSRLGDDTGWLYKHSGSTGDGYKTNSTQANPYEPYFCFWTRNPPGGCTTPGAAELETYLPEHLNIDQMLRFGGTNAILANPDSPFMKENNFYWYDSAAPRVYLPWDLDTTMKGSPALFGNSGTTLYTSVLFTHWEDDYDVLLTQLLSGPLALSEINAELDRVVTVAGPALESDPTLAGQSASSAVAGMKSYWTTRHAQLTSELQAHAP